MKKQVTNDDLVNLINKKFSDIDKKFDGIDEKFDTLGKKVSLLDRKVDDRVNDLEDKMFNWKSEIIDSVDMLAKEVNDQRDFRDITTNQITEVTERVSSVEKKVFGKVCVA